MATFEVVSSESSSSAQELREALDRIGDGFIVYDREWRIVDLNRRAEEYFARSRDELIGRVVWETFPTAVGTEAEREFRAAAARTEPTEREMFAPAMKRWVAFRMFPSDRGVSISFRDVTEDRQIREALAASEARHRAMVAHSLDGILLTAPTGEILAANEAACQMFGRTEAEIRAAGRAGVMDPSDPNLAAAVEERRRTGHVRAKLTAVRKDGTRFPVEIASSVYRDAEGRDATSMIVRDLTERERAEDRLRLIADAGVVLGRSLESEATLGELTRLAVPRMADLSVVDLLEEGALRRVAASHRDPAQQAAALTVSPGRIASRAGGIYKVARTGEAELVPVMDETWLRGSTRDDAHLSVAKAYAPRSAVMVPILGRTGVIGVLSLFLLTDARRYDASDLATARAIADRAAFAIENARLYEQAVQAKRVRDDALGMVSHDLRGPLNAIELNAQLLERVSAAPELTRIRHAVRRADALIQDLLTVAALEEGAMPLHRSRVAIGALVDEALDLQRAQAAARSIELGARVAPALPEVHADTHRILQVLGNLLDNALKFTPEGGRIQVEAHEGEGAVVLSVSDTGCGISAAALPRVFDRFWQVAKSRRGGAGLGLAIVKGVVEAHGGTIAVESEPGRGTTFRFTLPLRVEPRGRAGS